jgi:hypothetical protein
MNLRDKVLFPYVFACNKHGLAPDAQKYAEEYIDSMSNSEFLQALSDALEALQEKANWHIGEG